MVQTLLFSSLLITHTLFFGKRRKEGEINAGKLSRGSPKVQAHFIRTSQEEGFLSYDLRAFIVSVNVWHHSFLGSTYPAVHQLELLSHAVTVK